MKKIKIDEEKLYNYIHSAIKDMKDTPTEELILMMMGSYHLESSNDCSFSINTAIAGTALITTMLATGPILLAGGITASIACCAGLIKNGIKERRIEKLKNRLIEEIMNRYPNFLEAYIDVAKMIENVEREDLIDFFKKTNAYNE